MELRETCYGVSEEVCGIMFILLWEIQRGAKGRKGRMRGNKHRIMKAGNKKGQLHLNRLLVGMLLWSNPAPDHQGLSFLLTKSFPSILFCVVPPLSYV